MFYIEFLEPSSVGDKLSPTDIYSTCYFNLFLSFAFSSFCFSFSICFALLLGVGKSSGIVPPILFMVCLTACPTLWWVLQAGRYPKGVVWRPD